MGIVAVDISMSLDGYIAGPNDTPEQGLGERGERLHEWIYEPAAWRSRHGLPDETTDSISEQLDEAYANTGAMIIGRRMFDIAEGPWGNEPPFHMPVFVVTHRAREPLAKQGGTTFYFMTDGIDGALEQARAAGGRISASVAAPA